MRLMNAFAGLSLILRFCSTTTLSAQCLDTDAPVISNMPANITGTADAGLLQYQHHLDLCRRQPTTASCPPLRPMPLRENCSQWASRW